MKMPRAKFSLKHFLSRPATKVILGGIIMLSLLVGGAVAYVWWAGKFGPKIESAVDDRTKQKSNALPVPVKLDPNSSIGVSIQSITSPVPPGANSSIIIKTFPEAQCSIKVTYKVGGQDHLSTDSGLMTKQADEYGMASWTWTVESSAPLGRWPVEVDCHHHGKSAKVIGDLIVAKPKL